MNSKKMGSSFTGYLVGKVQLDGAIQSEVLTSLVATLFQRYTTPTSTDPAAKKTPKFNDNTKYFVECSERGLKLTSPGVKPKDEGFESDCDSIRSTTAHNGDSSLNELDLADVMNQLNVSGKQALRSVDNRVGGTKTNSSNLASLSSASSGNSIDNTSISSSQNIQVSDDNNSSSGNGSDSDEFCTPPNSSTATTNNNSSSDELHHHRTSPYWEILPNLSSFQSYPIEDVVFCHCDIVHPNVLVWVVRHAAKMIAFVTAFRTKAESEQLFQRYREIRVLVKPFKNASNTNNSIKLSNIGSNKLSIVPSPQSVPITLHPAQQPPIPAESELVPYSSLPAHVMPTEILYESKSNSPPLFFGSRESKSRDFRFDEGALHVGKSSNRLHNYYGSSSNTISSTYSKLTKLTAPWTSSISSASSSSTLRPSSKSLSASSPIIFPPNQPQHFTQPGIKRFDGSSSLLSRIENNVNASEDEEDDSDSDEVESQQESFKTPLRTLRKTGDTSCSSILQQVQHQSKPTTSTKPVVLVPLKTETVSSPRPIYPKESYLYHVMGRTSSTFAPYQRSINFLPQYAAVNGANNANMNGTEYLAWGNERHALLPFSSWVEIADANKMPHNVNGTTSRKMCYAVPKTRPSSSRSSSSRTSALAHLKTSNGTAKILLRDSAGNHHGMWTTLSQRFKRNIRESLMQKFNSVWPNQMSSENRGNFGAVGRGKRKGNKKVTFNAWATVQMV